MELKKNWRTNLENYRSIFFLAGIALSLLLTTEILELKSAYAFPELKADQAEQSEAGTVRIPKTFRETPKIPEPLKKDVEPDPIVDPKKRFKIVDNSTLLNTSNLEPVSMDTIFFESTLEPEVPEPIEAILVENMARPQDCEALRGKEEQMKCFNTWISTYLANEIEFPDVPDFMARSEKVFVEFVIKSDGKVSDVVILRGEIPEYRAEAKRVIENLPKLVPASQLGRAVPVRVRIPVNFKIR